MKYSDINKKFSDKVLEYMMNGYVINSKSMSGHQGEEGKVDLIKGDELLRVYLYRESSYNWDNKNAWHGTVIVLRVGRWKYPASKIRDSFDTVWMKDLVIMEEYKYYEISNKWYIESEEEAVAIQKTRYRRWTEKSCYYQDDKIDIVDAEDIAAKYLKRTQGYKRIHRDKIRVSKMIERNHGMTAKTVYRIIYNSNVYYLS